MPIDHTRRGLLRVVTLAGISAAVLPGKRLFSDVEAAVPLLASPPTPIVLNGWILNDSDR